MEDSEASYKVIRDPIHGSIHFPSIIFKVINCPLFQRTRRVNQLGVVHYVFPSATHTRFSHMIGTAHLAGRVCDRLGIIDDERLIIVLSGLLHDIGHAPLSHLYEQAGGSHHEPRSSQFVRFIAKYYVPEISKYTNQICACILGEIVIKDKPYLSEIVSNKLTGIDVDKLDYMLRDCYYTGVKTTIDVDRLIDNICISKDKHIVFRKKVLEDVINIFRTRYDLHQRVYQHRVVRIIGAMLVEILKENIKYEPTISNKDICDNDIKDRDEMEYISKWLVFTDDWFDQLRVNGNDKTKKIFHNIDQRSLFKCVQEFNVIGEATNVNNISKDLILDISYISSGYKNNILCNDGVSYNIDSYLPRDHTIVRYLQP